MRAAGVELLSYTQVTDAIVTDGRIRGVIVQNKSGRQALLAKTVVDATGDADMWTRGQYCCLVTGQVAGVAAAMAAREDSAPRALDVRALRRALAAQGVDTGATPVKADPGTAPLAR